MNRGNVIVPMEGSAGDGEIIPTPHTYKEEGGLKPVTADMSDHGPEPDESY